MSRRWCVVTPYGTVYSRHIDRERAVARARQRGPDYTVRPVGSVVLHESEPARPLGRPPTRGEPARHRLELTLTELEMAKLRERAGGRPLAAYVREMALGGRLACSEHGWDCVDAAYCADRDR